MKGRFGSKFRGQRDRRRIYERYGFAFEIRRSHAGTGAGSPRACACSLVHPTAPGGHDAKWIEAVGVDPRPGDKALSERKRRHWGSCLVWTDGPLYSFTGRRAAALCEGLRLVELREYSLTPMKRTLPSSRRRTYAPMLSPNASKISSITRNGFRLGLLTWTNWRRRSPNASAASSSASKLSGTDTGLRRRSIPHAAAVS